MLKWRYFKVKTFPKIIQKYSNYTGNIDGNESGNLILDCSATEYMDITGNSLI